MANVTTDLQSGRPSDASGGRGDYKMAHTYSLAGLATSDVLYCHTIPAGHRVRNVTLEVVEATGETCVVAVGMASDLVGTLISSGTGFDASADVNAAVGTLTTGDGGTDAHVTDGGYLNLTPAVTYVVLVPTVSASPLGTLGQVRVIATVTDET